MGAWHYVIVCARKSHDLSSRGFLMHLWDGFCTPLLQVGFIRISCMGPYCGLEEYGLEGISSGPGKGSL